VAEALFRAQPVELVSLTDKEPTLPPETGYLWYDQGLLDGAFPGEGPHEYGLPGELFDLLTDGHSVCRGCQMYPSRDAAHASLSAAACRLGRTRAGVG
jgi:hypothetical protein